MTCAREPWLTAMAGRCFRPKTASRNARRMVAVARVRKKVGGTVPPDDHVVKAVRLGDLFHLPKAPSRQHHVIAGLFESPDDGREEVSVGRVIQVDPDAHLGCKGE